MKRIVALAVVAVSTPALAAAAQATPASPLHSAAAAGPTYKNAAAPIGTRVNDLLSRMTLQEKVGQMDQIVVGRLRAAAQGARLPTTVNAVLRSAARTRACPSGSASPQSFFAVDWLTITTRGAACYSWSADAGGYCSTSERSTWRGTGR